MAIRRNKVPPHVRRAIRTALGVGLACSFGYGIFIPFEPGSTHYVNEVAKACKWAAITCVVVTVPVLGKVAQVGFERTLGTLIGGVCGFVTYKVGSSVWNDTTDGFFLSAASMAFAYCCVLAAQRLKLDVSAKLTMITFLLVTFGAGDDGPEGALETAITRVCGIMSGVVLSLVLSMLIYPKSASLEAVWETKKALDSLAKLGDICWKTQGIWEQEVLQTLSSQDPPGGSFRSASVAGLATPDLEAALLGSQSAVEEIYQAEAEGRLTDVYNSLAKAKDMSEQAGNEVLVGFICGRWCFAPSVSCCQGKVWRVVRADMEDLATHLRKISRLLWTVHLTFEEGFDENMRTVLKQQYPAGLLPRLYESCQGTLKDMADAFPNAREVPSKNLKLFTQAVEALIRISDYYRRRVLRHLTGYRPAKTLRRHLSHVSSSPGDGDEAAQTAPPAEAEMGGPDAASLSGEVAGGGGQLPPSNSRQDMHQGPATKAQDIGDLDTLTIRDTFVGSPRGAFEGVPAQLKLHMQAASKKGASGRAVEHSGSGRLVVTLPNVDNEDLALFPETPEGHVSQVRWYSFQFLMEELCELLEDGVEGVNKVLHRVQQVEECGGWVHD